jgi:CYTH domain-containing protein
MSYEAERKFLPSNSNWRGEIFKKYDIFQAYIDLNKVKIVVKNKALIIITKNMFIRKHITKRQENLLLKNLHVTNKVLRIRKRNNTLFLTLKIDIGMIGKQIEVEKDLSPIHYNELKKYTNLSIDKVRNLVNFDNNLYEVDEFKGNNKDLVLIEVELSDINKEINLPEWVGQEVTGNAKYYNSVLAKN